MRLSVAILISQAALPSVALDCSTERTTMSRNISPDANLKHRRRLRFDSGFDPTSSAYRSYAYYLAA